MRGGSVGRFSLTVGVATARRNGLVTCTAGCAANATSCGALLAAQQDSRARADARPCTACCTFGFISMAHKVLSAWCIGLCSLLRAINPLLELVLRVVSLDGFLVSLDGFSGWFLGFLVSLVSSAETFFHPSFTSLFLNLAPEMSNPFSSINH